MASSSKNPMKRFGFRRTNTGEIGTVDDSHGKVTSVAAETELTELDDEGAPRSASISKIGGAFAGRLRDDDDEAVKNISEVEANRKLNAFKKEHKWDPNMPDEAWEAVDATTAAHDQKGEAVLVNELVEDSPYPEVRACVRNYDEDLPASTIRAWVIGLVLTTIASGINGLFILRFPAVQITTYVVQLVAYPIAKGWDLVMPNRQFNTFGIKWNLNPGPFNVKEHTIIVVMANAAFGGGTGYFIDTVVTIQKFFGTKSFGWGWNILFALSTQCLGFGLAGSVRRWLVEPAAMLWPGALINVAFMYALHDHRPSDPSKTHGWSIGRYKWFLIIFAAMFTWEWFPTFIFPALSLFAWTTWIAPNNTIVNQLLGMSTGISLGFPFTSLTLDWAQINSFYGSPLISPWHALANTGVGVIFFLWIVTPAIHYTGGWYAKYLPISENAVLDNTASPYNISRILLPDNTVDHAAYEAYSPLFLPTTFALTYGTAFGTITALVSHTYLHHGTMIWDRLRAARGEGDDIHMKIMRKYKMVPDWWYLSLLLVMIGFAFACACGWDTGMAAYSVVLALVIAAAWTIPIGIIQAMTNIQLGLNVFTEFIISYLQPGHPIAMMMFKTFGYITMTQALYFCQDLKLGHYMHVPQRSMFIAQFVATVWSALVQLGTVEWALGAIKGICTAEAPYLLTCDYIKTFYNASVIWGAIGAKRIFGSAGIYKDLQYFWLIGFFAPIILYALARAFPKMSIFRKANVPLIFSCMGYIPPYSTFNILAFVGVGWVFNSFIRDRYRGWWMQYNYVTSAAMDTGLAICTLILFLCVQLPGGSMPAWWGSNVELTSDFNGTDIQVSLTNGTFGPTSWPWDG